MLIQLIKPLKNAVSSVLQVAKRRHYRCGGFCGTLSPPSLLADAHCSEGSPNVGVALVCGCEKVIDFTEVSIKPLPSGNSDSIYYETCAIVEAIKWYISRFAHFGVPIVMTDCKPAHKFLSEGNYISSQSKKAYFNPLLSVFLSLLKTCPIDFPVPIGRFSTLYADIIARYGLRFFDGGMNVESLMAKLVDVEKFLNNLNHENLQAQLYLSDRELFYGRLAAERESVYAGYVVVVLPKSVAGIDSEVTDADAEAGGKPLVKGRVLNCLLQAYSLKKYLKNVVDVRLHRATRLILLRNNDVVKDVKYGADDCNDGGFFVITLSKDQPNSVNFGKSDDSFHQLKNLNLYDHFDADEDVVLYTANVLRDSVLGNRLEGKYLLLIALKRNEED